MKKISLNTLLIIGSFAGSTTLYAQQQVGIGTSTPKAFFNVVDNRDVLFGLDVNGGGNKLIWYGTKGAFRAGNVNGVQWNTDAVGTGSFASGLNTRASGVGATALGNSTEATGLNTTAMGFGSKASGETATALGNLAEAPGISAISIGTQTSAGGPFSTALGHFARTTALDGVAIGNQAEARGVSAMSIGTQTLASGPSSIALGSIAQATAEEAVAIGNTVEASGANSTALGYNVSTNGKSGSVIIGDRSSNRYVSDNDQKMTMRFGGGYVLYSAGGPQRLGDPFFIPPGVELRPGANSWFFISDSTKKENFRAVDGALILQKISKMRLGTWNYRGQDPKIFRHYGPMAQDFFAAFGHDELGVIGEPTGINQADFDGINFTAIKALITEVDLLKADNQRLRQQLQEVQQLRADLDSAQQQEKTTQARLAKIEALLSAPAGTSAPILKPQTGR